MWVLFCRSSTQSALGVLSRWFRGHGSADQSMIMLYICSPSCTGFATQQVILPEVVLMIAYTCVALADPEKQRPRLIYQCGVVQKQVCSKYFEYFFFLLKCVDRHFKHFFIVLQGNSKAP